MSNTQRTASSHEKQQMRDQISCQIEEFLRRGGEIRVLDEPGERNGAKRASVWHGQEDIQELID